MKAKIYIKKYTPKKEFDWGGSYKIPYISYDITETDFRTKTATFDSSHKINLGKGSYAVKITHPCFETFSGIILDVEDKKNGKYSYQCQDWNRIYMGKPIIHMKSDVYFLVKKMLSYSTDNSSWSWKGLLSLKKYNQRKYGSTFEFNPFKNIKNVDIKDKPVKEAIDELVYSQHPFIDIHYNTTGIMKFTPYYLKEWKHPTVEIPLSQTTDYNYKLDTTNIIITFMDKGKPITFKKLFNSKKNVLKGFTTLKETMPTENTNAKTSNTNKTSTKQGNPYGTKKKEVWVNMDECWGHSADNRYLTIFCNELKKLGWKVHKLGVKPSLHTDYGKASQCRNGIWLTLDNGVDCEVLRHFGHDEWFKGQLVRHNSRAVIGFINNAGNIKKGGKYYKHLGMAHDGTGKGNPGLRYPAGYCADCGLPFFYSKGNNPKDAARIFNNGGDSKIALEKNYKKKIGGYYKNWNWSSKY